MPEAFSAPRSYDELITKHSPQIHGYLRFMGVPERELDDALGTLFLLMVKRDFLGQLFKLMPEPTRAGFNWFLFKFMRQTTSAHMRKASRWLSRVSTHSNMKPFMEPSNEMEENLHYHRLYRNFRAFLKKQEAARKIRIHRPDVPAQLLDLLLFGFSSVEIARKFKVNPSFVTYWKSILQKQAEEFQTKDF